MTLVLSPQEITDLTARVRARAQARQLAHMRIPYTERSDGSLAVLRVHVEGLTAAAANRDDEPRPRVRFD
jgi:hypothetical protein